MTFDSATYFPQFFQADDSLFDGGGRAGYTPLKRRERPNKPMETNHDYCEKTEISDWESEGGAIPNNARDLFRDDSVNTVSFLSEHIETAEALLEAGDYDAAVHELESAAHRFMTYKDKIDRSFNRSITRLTTLGTRATPPHPKAVTLVKLRQQITA